MQQCLPRHQFCRRFAPRRSRGPLHHARKLGVRLQRLITLMIIIIAYRCKKCHHHRSMHALQGGHIICQSLDNTCGRCATASAPIPMLPYGFTEIRKVLSDLFNHDRVITRRTPSETGQENGGRRVERIRTKRTRPSEMKESRMIFPAPPNARFADA